MAFKTAFKAADHRVGLVAHHGKGCNGGRVGADDCARSFRRDALTARIGQIKIDIVAIARIVFGVDKLEIGAGADF